MNDKRESSSSQETHTNSDGDRTEKTEQSSKTTERKPDTKPVAEKVPDHADFGR